MSHNDLISSNANQVIKYIRSLRTRRNRQAERVVVIEGWKLLSDLVNLGILPVMILLRQDEPGNPLLESLDAVVRTAT